jgi:membrane fusion protein (multidrug efflux system)
MTTRSLPLQSLGALLAAVLLGGGAAAAPSSPFDGIVLPFKEVVVSSPVQSIVESIAFKEGDRVQAGQVLSQLSAKIEELDMQRAKAALTKKEFDYKGSKNLFADRIISEDEALKNKIELELARLQYEQSLELFKQRTLLSPIDGVVVEKMKEAGEAVTATQPMFRLMDIRRVYIQLYLGTQDLPLVTMGKSVKISCTVGAETHKLSGTVDFVDPRADAASGLMRVKVLVDNEGERIKPGLRASVRLE